MPVSTYKEAIKTIGFIIGEKGAQGGAVNLRGGAGGRAEASAARLARGFEMRSRRTVQLGLEYAHFASERREYHLVSTIYCL